MAGRSKQLIVQGVTINVTSIGDEDYICLTDMVRNIGGGAVIEKWLRSKNTIEYLGIWELLNNPDFNSLEFEGIKSQAGTNRFVLSAKQWVDVTSAIGISARAGRYGGTYAHKDVAFEFATWVSPEFRFLVIKEFQRLKQQEQHLEQWDYHRFLTKINYRLQTSAVREMLIPSSTLPKDKTWFLYAEEADIINVAIFGISAKDWRTKNSKQAKQGQNLRDSANIEQLTVLANLESLNSMLISQNLDKEARLLLLRNEASRQLAALAPLHDKLAPGKIQTRLEIRGEVS